MPRMPQITGRELLRALRRHGWYIVTTTGHHKLAHPDRPGVTLIAPTHPSATMTPGTLRNMLTVAGLTPDDLR